MIAKRIWIGIPLLGLLFAARLAVSLPGELRLPDLREVKLVAGAILDFPHGEPGSIGAVVRGVAAATRPGVRFGVEGWNAFWSEVSRTHCSIREDASPV